MSYVLCLYVLCLYALFIICTLPAHLCQPVSVTTANIVETVMPEALQITTSAGHHLHGHLFVPDQPLDRVVIINSAMGVLKRYYADFATYLTSEGFHVITYDYHGIGESLAQPIQQINTNLVQWAQEDYAAVITHARARFPNARLLVLGHSVGGQLIGMTPASQQVDAFLLVASQTPYWPNFPTWPKLWALWYFMIPVLTPAFGYFPARKLGLFENIPKEVALQWMRCARNASYIFAEHPRLQTHFESLRQPMRVVSLTDDTYAPLKAVNDLIRFYSMAEIKQHHIHPKEVGEKRIGHFGFFRKKVADSLWKDTAQWLKKQG